MIGFFRRIRKKFADENKPMKYMRYAIGEILLVVIGILIALQVNNWNEERNDQEKIKSLTKSLIQDLENDIKMIDTIQYLSKQITLRIDSLSNYVRNEEIEEISNLDVVCLSWMKLYRPFSWNRATFDDLKSSGGLHLIKNSELSKKIIEYDTFTRHMDEDYEQDNLQSNNAWKLISEITNANFPNIVELREVIRYTANYGTIEDLFTSSEYLEAKSYHLELTTGNRKDLINAMNNYIRLQFNIEIRIEIELPKLIADAREIISLLNNEY